MPISRTLAMDIRHMHVHRLAGHVLALLGDRAGAPAQHRVGLGRAIGGDDRIVGASEPTSR
jgi:hypothetical protein